MGAYRGAGAFTGGGGSSGGSFTGGTLTSALLFSADNSHDIGAAGATRPRSVYIGTSLNVADDTDASTILGRVRLDARGTDIAYFSHYDNTATADYALFQNAAGATGLNSKNGQTTTIRCNSTVRFSVNATGVSFFAATPVAQSTGWAVTNVVSDKTFDANATTVDELADVVGTLITYLISRGDLAA